MQTLFRLFLLVGLVALPLAGRADANDLQRADSLYAAGRYRTALTHYEGILADGRYSPQMLLKMAFIEEGLDRYARTLYYLSLYYRERPERAVQRKMEELAETYDLRGYEPSGLDFALAAYYRYGSWLLVGALLGAALMVGLIWWSRRRGEFALYYPVFLVFFLAVAFYLVNYGDRYRLGVVARPQTHLRSAPAASAPLHEIVEAGHRLTVSGQRDVWYRVDWRGQTAFVHRDNLLLMR